MTNLEAFPLYDLDDDDIAIAMPRTLFLKVMIEDDFPNVDIDDAIELAERTSPDELVTYLKKVVAEQQG